MKIQGPGYGDDVARPDRSGKPDAPVRPDQTAQAQPQAQPPGGDEVRISAAALEIQRLLDAAKAAPDVRADTVKQLQEAIRSGRYKVDDRSLVLRLIEEYLAK